MSTDKVLYSSEAQVTELTTGEQFLLAIIRYECPACGSKTLAIPGHHLRSLARLLQAFIDEYPQLCYRDNEVEMMEGFIPKGQTH